MTAQMSNAFRLYGDAYSLVATSNGDFFDISIFDIPVWPVSTACIRGYVAEFAVSDGRLVLDNLFVSPMSINLDTKNLEFVDGPMINGVKPVAPPPEDRSSFTNHYHGLNVHLEYTGGILIARGFIQKLYLHLGYQPARCYHEVRELIFENGALANEYDRSDPIAEIREFRLSANDSETLKSKSFRKEWRRRIKKAFHRRYGIGSL